MIRCIKKARMKCRCLLNNISIRLSSAQRIDEFCFIIIRVLQLPSRIKEISCVTIFDVSMINNFLSFYDNIEQYYKILTIR